MGEETTTKVKKETALKKLKFSVKAPSGATKVLGLMAALVIIKGGIELFWNTNPNPVSHGLLVFYGIMLIILAGILIIILDFIDFGVPFFNKLFKWWIILIAGLLIFLFEILSLYLIKTSISAQLSYAGVYLLGGILTVIAAILELTAGKQKMKPSLLVALFGAVFAIYESIILFVIGGGGWNIYHGILGIIFVAVLLILMLTKIDLKIKYEWWIVLIIGFVLFSWVTPFFPNGSGTGGTIVLISFILMLLAY